MQQRATAVGMGVADLWTCRPLNCGSCGTRQPRSRPTRWPRRVLKLFSISSGRCPVFLPCPLMVCGITRFVSLKRAVGPCGSLTIQRPWHYQTPDGLCRTHHGLECPCPCGISQHSMGGLLEQLCLGMKEQGATARYHIWRTAFAFSVKTRSKVKSRLQAAWTTCLTGTAPRFRYSQLGKRSTTTSRKDSSLSDG